MTFSPLIAVCNTSTFPTINTHNNKYTQGRGSGRIVRGKYLSIENSSKRLYTQLLSNSSKILSFRRSNGRIVLDIGYSRFRLANVYAAPIRDLPLSQTGKFPCYSEFNRANFTRVTIPNLYYEPRIVISRCNHNLYLRKRIKCIYIFFHSRINRRVFYSDRCTIRTGVALCKVLTIDCFEKNFRKRFDVFDSK